MSERNVIGTRWCRERKVIIKMGMGMGMGMGVLDVGIKNMSDTRGMG